MHIRPGRIALMLLVLPAWTPGIAQWEGFENAWSIDSGISAPFQMPMSFTTHLHVGGAVAGDIDGDGDLDLVVLRGMHSPRVFENDGHGRFSDTTSNAGLAGIEGLPNGVLLADVDGDGSPDLLLGGATGDRHDPGTHTPIRLFINDGSGVFADATAESNLTSPLDAHSMALADIDRDGDLDLFIAYWHQQAASTTGHLWRNLGDGRFEDISQTSGIGQYYQAENTLYNFTSTFSDVDGDSWPDLLVSADFGHSRVFINQGGGSFADATDPDVITDENGMGAAVGDFDNDGDFDWFVTSIRDEAGSPYYGTSGNRLYRNEGSGTFVDATEAAGVRDGGWGWGACAADFNNDGWLDLFMVNGYQGHRPTFLGNPARLFINTGDGSFEEQAQQAGIATTGLGRAVVCFDSDRDGQIDVLVQNSHDYGDTAVQPQFYRNLGSDNHWMGLRLIGPPANRHAIGARVIAQTDTMTQVREIRAGGSFLSSPPAEVHFGLGSAATLVRLTIRWPDGKISQLEDIAGDRLMTVDYNHLFRSRFD